MNLYELWKQLDKIIGDVGYKKAAEMPVTLVVDAIDTDTEQHYEIERPLHEVALGKDAIHLICPDV